MTNRSRQSAMTRRAWCRGATLATVGTGTGIARPEAGVSSPAATRTPDGYFDLHVHLTQGWHAHEREPITARALIAWMDARGIAEAAVLPLVSPEAFWYPLSTDFVLRETAPHRDRLIPFCAIDPRTLETHLPNRADVVALLRRYQDAGARGFGEHKPRLAIDDPLNWRLYEACAETGLPVLFHLDNLANMDQPGLPGLARTLARFPEVRMIGHGKGWWASIAGGVRQEDLHVGYPRGPVAAGGAIDALMDRFPNLYGDLSSSGAHALLRDPDFGRAFIERRGDRLLFGTDYYDASQVEFRQFDLFAELGVDAATRDMIARGTARRLLGLA